METATQLLSFRAIGIILLVTVIVFMIGAFAAAYFRQWPLPTTSLQKLTLIAHDRVGWTAQAILFPLAFLTTAIIFGLVAANLPGSLPRWLAMGGTVLAAAACLLWLPITLERLQLGAKAAEMLRTYDPAHLPEVMVNSRWAFWPHTLCLLAAIALMGAALAVGGVLPSLGWIVTVLAVGGAVIGLLVMRDWPPFMSYIIILVLAIGLMRLPSAS